MDTASAASGGERYVFGVWQFMTGLDNLLAPWLVSLLSIGAVLYIARRGVFRQVEISAHAQIVQQLQFELKTCHEERRELRTEIDGLEGRLGRLEDDLRQAREQIVRLVMRA